MSLQTAIEALQKKESWSDPESVKRFAKTITEICEHYAAFFNKKPIEIFKLIESKRDYSYPNYWQWANFPKLESVNIYETKQDLLDDVKPELGFRCPRCKGITMDPYECKSGKEMEKGKICDWKVYGFFKSTTDFKIIVKDKFFEDGAQVERVFLPISKEKS